jgi:NADH:ubiquinone oxidoreductase subunit 3 (subunit A)
VRETESYVLLAADVRGYSVEMNPGNSLIMLVASPWPPIVALLAGGLVFGITPLALAKLWAMKFSPAKPGAQKNAIYECGLESEGDAWIQFKASYYLYAIIFLIFDVEAIFLLPFAVAFTGLSVGACVAMLVFLLLLLEGLVWACQKGVLTWS